MSPASERDFVDRCERLFRELGYEVDREYSIQTASRRVTFDMLIRPTDSEERRPVEVKEYGEREVTLQEIRNAAARLSWTATLYVGLRRPILVINDVIVSVHREWVENEYKIEVWDLERLHKEAASIGSSLFERPASRAGAEALVFSSRAHVHAAATLSRSTGRKLCGELKAIPKGPKDSKQYEQKCAEIIDYLFGDSLVDGQQQTRSVDGLNIMDIVYRLLPGNQFWETLGRDFRARTIVFECKNYEGEIPAYQVYTTERYIYPQALRSVCFVLCRIGPHAHALAAASGALRESGKLLIFLNDNDLCEMLKVRDEQLDRDEPAKSDPKNAPTELLDQKIYKFIATLNR